MPESSDKDVLTLQAKEAIRGYLLKLIVLPGIASVVVSFLVGFFIKDVAQARAYNDAYKEVAGDVRQLLISINQTKADIETSKGQIERIKTDAATMQAELDRVLKSARTTEDSLRTAAALQTSEKVVADIAGTLVKRDDFKTAVASGIATDLQRLQKELVATQGSIRTGDKQMLELATRIGVLDRWLLFVYDKARETGLPKHEGANGYWQKALIDGWAQAHADTVARPLR